MNCVYKRIIIDAFMSHNYYDFKYFFDVKIPHVLLALLLILNNLRIQNVSHVSFE
jgi:hypothetical protein